MGVAPIGSTAFDIYPISYYAMLHELGEKTGDRQKDKASLSRTNYQDGPPLYPTHAQELDKKIDQKILLHTNLLMRNYYDHFKDLTLEKELLIRILNRKVLNQQWAKAGLERSQELALYVLHLLLERAFLNAIARHNAFVQLSEKNHERDTVLLEWKFVKNRAISERMDAISKATKMTRDQNQVDLIAPWARDDLELYYIYFDPIALRQETQALEALKPQMLEILGAIFTEKASELQKMLDHQNSKAALKLLRDMHHIFLYKMQSTWLTNENLEELVHHSFQLRLHAWNQALERGKASSRVTESDLRDLDINYQAEKIYFREKTLSKYAENAAVHLGIIAHDEHLKTLRTEAVEHQRSAQGYNQLGQSKALSEISLNTAHLEAAWKNPTSFSPDRNNSTVQDIMRHSIARDKEQMAAINSKRTGNASSALEHFREQLTRGVASSDLSWAFENARQLQDAMRAQGATEKGGRVNASKKIGQV